jgi:hypothetical protein
MKLAADAVGFEPVSTPKFPANREINREFHQIGPLGAILKADARATSEACSEIPYETEQGIISEEQGILAEEQGFCLRKPESSPDEVSVHTPRLRLGDFPPWQNACGSIPPLARFPQINFDITYPISQSIFPDLDQQDFWTAPSPIRSLQLHEHDLSLLEVAGVEAFAEAPIDG